MGYLGVAVLGAAVVVSRSTKSQQVVGGFGTPHVYAPIFFPSKLDSEFAPWGAVVGTSKYCNSQDY
jgi:hypothetical protein